MSSINGKPKLLFLTQRIPFPPNKGEKIRHYQIIKYLRQHFDLFIGCLIDSPDDWQHRETVDAWALDTQYAGLDPKLEKLRCLRGLLTNESLSFTYFHNADLQRWVDRIIDEEKPEVCFVCSSNMARYIYGKDDRFRQIIVDFADVDSEKWREYAERGTGPMKWVHAREYRLVTREESKITRFADAVTFVSDAEADFFVDCHRGTDLEDEARRKSVGVSNGVDSDFFRPHSAHAPLYDTSRPTFVFTGTMDYPPNVDAVRWFTAEILPIIRKTLPEACFYIVGQRPAKEVLALAQTDGVHVTGMVDDVRPYLAHASAVVAPIRIARGIQNKVLEAMSMARPVITTPEALEGIDARHGEEVHVASSPEEIAAAAVQLAGSEAGDIMGEKARDCVVEKYSWAAHLSGFGPYLGLAQEPPADSEEVKAS